MINQKTDTLTAKQHSADENVEAARLGPSLEALGAALAQFINARLALFKAEWHLTLSALALSFIALVALGALLAMAWFASLAALSYGVSVWLGHWLWGVCLFGLSQIMAITFFWKLSRHFIGKIGFQHSLTAEDFTHVKSPVKT